MMPSVSCALQGRHCPGLRCTATCTAAANTAGLRAQSAPLNVSDTLQLPKSVLALLSTPALQTLAEILSAARLVSLLILAQLHR